MTADTDLDQVTSSPVDLGELASSLGFLLRISQVRVYQQFYSHFGDLDLRPGEFSVLWVVHLNPGIKQGLLARTLRIKPAHMTKIVRRLEDQGIIRRHIPDDDRRTVHLSLTDAGVEFIKAEKGNFFGQESYHQHALTANETQEFVRLLRKYAGIDHKGETWVSTT